MKEQNKLEKLVVEFDPYKFKATESTNAQGYRFITIKPIKIECSVCSKDITNLTKHEVEEVRTGKVNRTDYFVVCRKCYRPETRELVRFILGNK